MVFRPTNCCDWPRASSNIANIRWPGPSSPRRTSGTIPLAPVEDFQSVTGGGVAGRVEGKLLAVGQRSLLADRGLDGFAALDPLVAQLAGEGQTVMYVGVERQAAGLLAVSDPLKPSTPEALSALHALGLTVIMLTGDNQQTARAVAKKLGIEQFTAGVRPEEKHRRVEALRAAGTTRGDGRRRNQRRAGAGRGRRGHRDGNRNRRGDGIGRRDARQRRLARHRQGDRLEPAHDAKYPGEPVLRLRLQRLGHSDRGRGALSLLRTPTAQSDDRRRGDEPESAFRSWPTHCG